MKEHLQQTVELMRKHVMRNLDLIKSNENHIREVLNWPSSAERTNELNEGYKYSKSLLAENNEFINLQVSIMNFLNKYKDRIESEDNVVRVNAALNTAKVAQQNLSRDEYFKLTTENTVAYDSKHPYFSDDKFFSELMVHYQNTENYEMCASLIKLKQ